MLGLAICYALALQAFLAAHGTAFAVARPDPFGGNLIICHGAGGSGPVAADSGSPAGGEQPPCALCAVAAAAGALTSNPIAVAIPRVLAGSVGIPGAQPIAAPPVVRSGLARAPPSFA
jgi:hypothetical protein